MDTVTVRAAGLWCKRKEIEMKLINEITMHDGEIVTVTSETKAAFIAALERGHVFVGPDRVRSYPTAEKRAAVFVRVQDRHPLREDELRTVTERRSNHLRFSDGSRLYFDGFSTRKYLKYAYGNTELWMVCAKEIKDDKIWVMSYLTKRGEEA